MVFTMIRIISSKSFFIDLYILSSIYDVLWSNINQYDVSLASFKEILSLLIKSALLCAYIASYVLAPNGKSERFFRQYIVFYHFIFYIFYHYCPVKVD